MDKETLIANYFSGKLTVEEKQEFERLLINDPEFKKQVSFEKKVKASIFKQNHNALKSDLKTIENNLSRKALLKKWYWIAASVVIFIAISFTFFGNKKNNEALFAQYYTTAANTSHPIVRTENKAINKELKAYIAYENKDFKNAIPLFNEAYNNIKKSELLFYKAICLLETNKTNEAISMFLKHQTFKDVLYSKSMWYLALTYLKENQTVTAKQVLNIICENPENYNYKNAKILLSQL